MKNSIGFILDTLDGQNSASPYLNDIIVPFQKIGTGVVKIQFSIAVSAEKKFPTIVTLKNSNEGEFFSDSSGSTSLGTSVSYTTSGQKTLYFKPYTLLGNIIFRYPEDINALGLFSAGSFDPDNQWISNNGILSITDFDISQVSCLPKIEVLFLGSDQSQIGNINELSGLNNIRLIVMNAKTQFSGNTDVFKSMNLAAVKISGLQEFDINDMPNSVYLLQIEKASSLINSGSNSSPAFTGVDYMIILGNTGVRFSTSNTDKIIIALSASLPNSISSPKTYTISGTRSSASDSAVSTLSSKGYTISFT